VKAKRVFKDFCTQLVIVGIRHVDDALGERQAERVLEARFRIAPVHIAVLKEPFSDERLDGGLVPLQRHAPQGTRLAVDKIEPGAVGGEAAGLGQTRLPAWAVDEVLSTVSRVDGPVSRLNVGQATGTKRLKNPVATTGAATGHRNLRGKTIRCHAGRAYAPLLPTDAEQQPAGDGEQIEVAEGNLRLRERLQVAQFEDGSPDDVETHIGRAGIQIYKFRINIKRVPGDAEAPAGVRGKSLVVDPELVQGIEAELPEVVVVYQIIVERPVEEHRQAGYTDACVSTQEQFFDIARQIEADTGADFE